MNAREITVMNGGDWHGGYGLIPGPGHSPRDRSVKVIDAPDQPDGIVVHSYIGDPWQDVKTMLREQGAIPELDHANHAQRKKLCRVSWERPQVPKRRRWSERAQELWDSAGPLESEADVYFASRHVDSPCCNDVRFLKHAWHWPTKQQFPAILSRVTDFATGEPLTLHFTFIAPNGKSKAPVDQPRLLLGGHQQKGGVIRLVNDEDVTNGLGIAEGIETALSVMRCGWRPVWATVNAGNMATFPVLDGIESLRVFADGDQAGLDAAENVVRRWSAAGREVAVRPADG